ncbi:ATPase component of ABC transporters with duplicated ATPase domain [Owenweeksia hongkongensis DSM 17368]|uniref:Probable ATP-binding protein YbiT n=1 Tax=Owenweeksia hongkongensis (strain DSM 17368 / CIP 108786 / JCM 12287 / NRRL B-23963 / UST20020801) TaxID=926562 RepID=G8R084_OWEHD|nr:ABC-F family ATP-binding cassette domain-containing protein [Owenweeksia hongkongensis]AEV33750.1 ATPase component of ABC transporters with duplicated ATPase domain [Owenweeksia hongkongensis DSM 17368]
MLGINNISLQYNDRHLFRNISFLINPAEKIGLVGSNGAGKSTLLKVIFGEISTDAGNISRPKDFKLGYLPQELPLYDGRTVWEEAESAFSEIKNIETRLDEINHLLATREDYESQSYLDLIEELNHLTERFSLVGGYTYHADLEKILTGLGFTTEDFERQTTEFSGGWRMRIELAKLLLANNDVMLLDEPTNHLDINSIVWLESFLQSYEGAILMVSHDRTFLDNITNRTVEIVQGTVYDYPVPYTKFTELREERIQLQLQEQKNQEKEIKQTEQLIEKFRYKASKAAFAQNLIKKLDKMDRIDIDVDDSRKISFKFAPAPRSGKVVLEAENLTKKYDDKVIFKDANLAVNRLEKVAFVGQNGQGKSTLVKVVTEKLQHEGKLEIGHNVEIGYYAQEQAKTLDGNKTLLQTIEDAAPEDLRKRARDFLGKFLFTGEDVEKKVKVLSGGEKGRLALCKLLLRPYNLLVMDEPTNHLDMKSKEMLKNALLDYDGTLVLVSHDRYFLQDLVDKIYEFRNGEVKEFLGTINEYLEARKFDDFRQVEKQAEVKAAAAAKSEPKANNYEERKQLDKDIRKAENQVRKLEQEVEKLEAEIAEIDKQLLDPGQFQKLSKEPDFYEKYEAKKVNLEKAMADWEKWAAKLDKALAGKAELEA